MIHKDPESKPVNTSILDDMTLRIYGHQLSITLQIWIGFLLPTTFSILIFVGSFAIDAGVTHQLLRDGHNYLAAASLLIVYAPAIFCLILSLTKPPDLENLFEIILWYVIQIFHFVFFPIGVMHRFATKLFWSICSLSGTDPQREEALRYASNPHQMELFFLVDPLFHAAPQALLQAYILSSSRIITTYETDLTLAMSVIVSVTSLAKAVALYQRYESQQLAGRNAPWTLENDSSLAKALVNISHFDPAALMKVNNLHKIKKVQQQTARESSAPTLIAPAEEVRNLNTNATTSTTPEQLCSDLERNSPDTTKVASLEPKYKSMENHPASEMDQREERDELDENNPLLSQQRDETQQNISTAWNSQIQKDINRALESPKGRKRGFWRWPHTRTPPPTHTDEHQMMSTSPTMTPSIQLSSTPNPPEKFSQQKRRTKGLAKDEPFGIAVAYLGWWCFLLARVLAVSSFTSFYPWASLGIAFVHYALIVLYMCFCQSLRYIIAPALSLIFILCPIEIKVRYKYPNFFLLYFVIIVTVENTFTTLFWYLAAEWESWWYDYTSYIIFGGNGMAILYAAVYLYLFNPKPMYIDEV